MVRAVLILLLLTLASGSLPVDAGKHARRDGLIIRDFAGKRWPQATQNITVVNHSSYALEEVRLALGLWGLPGVPHIGVRPGTPTPCDQVKAKRGAVVLCDAPVTAAPMGWTITYVNKPDWNKNAKKARKRMRDLQGAVLWLTNKPDFTRDMRINLVAHEFGHTLGIPHIKCETCIMMENCGEGITKLSPEDLAALRALYPAPG